jgi:hypothetical protein
VGSVYTLLRYRSTFFIALQVHRFFVALGFFVGGALILGMEYLRDNTRTKNGQRNLKWMVKGVERMRS